MVGSIVAAMKKVIPTLTQTNRVLGWIAQVFCMLQGKTNLVTV